MDINTVLAPVMLCVAAIAGVALVYFLVSMLRDKLGERRGR